MRFNGFDIVVGHVVDWIWSRREIMGVIANVRKVGDVLRGGEGFSDRDHNRGPCPCLCQSTIAH